MCEAKRKILVTIPVTDAQREELTAAGGEDCILTFLPAASLTEEILAERTVIATGRRGADWLEELCVRHGIGHLPGTVAA